MKIAFWSEQKGAGTTFNLAVTACASVLLHPISVAIVPGGYHDEQLERKFFKTVGGSLFGGEPYAGQESFLAAESQEYFFKSGLECLLWKESREELTERVVKANMRQVVKDRLYCLPASARSEQEWWHEDHMFLRMRRVIEAVETYFDVVFIDCGCRQEDYARNVLRESDICVLNMDQEKESISEFYQNPPQFRGKTFILLGNYFEDGLYNRKNLQRLYRIEENMLGAMPYNPQLQAACQIGKLKNGLECYVGDHIKGKNVTFEKELVRTTNLILKLAGVVS